MIGRRGKVLILLYMIFLAVLFLMCSTDLIIREPEKEVYQIAVIIEDAKDDNYGNFRKGMDQAAMELNADVHFITLYEKMDAGQQMELISREQQDGADALIIIPADEERVVKALAEGMMTVPTVLIGSGLGGEKTAGTIAADYKSMGRRLAEAVMSQGDESSRVLVLEDPQKRSVMSRLFLEGAIKALEENGWSWESVVGQEDGLGFRSAIESLWSRNGGRVAILAETPEILTEAAGLLAEEPGSLDGGGAAGLYGRGSTVSILNYLDRGVITGICAVDEYGVGYFGVDMAVKALEGGERQRRIEMDSYYIEKEDLRKPEYEKLLYPVE